MKVREKRRAEVWQGSDPRKVVNDLERKVMSKAHSRRTDLLPYTADIDLDKITKMKKPRASSCAS